ncbi:MAG: hydrogenase maturation nickel metallochaperone HypA [Alphaproteobacteria bacterium]|nr:hydrogenase maturation nickel metallochaperone HypA [Alphaproteobacteria bacterium]MDE2109844.1 hydrogenase maturation nickel metallochaperone HypA [Alphaproteobacteria bacterium]MDE2493528.1 hydrogenase maturation nickel metallochaperone HypA [Alphaproteobacteria bacterium]
MHELSLATALMDLVREEAAAAHAQRVTRLVLEIGALSHVDAQALRFAVDVAARGGPAEGATLDIQEPPGTAYCLDCETSVTIAARGAPCPRCGGAKLLVQGGDEMRLKEMEVV